MPEGPELVIGLVTPVGTNTGEVAERLRAALSTWKYRSLIVKLTDFFNQQDPPQRVSLKMNGSDVSSARATTGARNTKMPRQSPNLRY